MRSVCGKCVHVGLQGSSGLDNLLYSADADFSCFADLAVTSPVDYYLEGQGSLMQCVLTPATQYMPMSNEDIAARVHQQVTLLLIAPEVLRLLVASTALWFEDEFGMVACCKYYFKVEGVCLGAVSKEGAFHRSNDSMMSLSVSVDEVEVRCTSLWLQALSRI